MLNQETSASILEICTSSDHQPTAIDLASRYALPAQLKYDIVCPDDVVLSGLKEKTQASVPWVELHTSDTYNRDRGEAQDGKRVAVVTHRESLDDTSADFVKKIATSENGIWSVQIQSDGSPTVTFIPPQPTSLEVNGKVKNGHDWDVLIFGASNNTTEMNEFAGNLASELEKHTFTPRRVVWSDQLPNVTGKKCIFLLDHSSPILEDLDEKSFQNLKRMLLTASDVTWISPKNTPGTGLILGLSRVIRNEVRGSVFRTIQIADNSSTVPDDARLVVKAVVTESADNEFLLEDGLIKISRVQESTVWNDNINSVLKEKIAPRAIGEANFGVKLGVQTPGMLSTLRFEPDKSIESELGDDEIEISVRASGIK